MKLITLTVIQYVVLVSAFTTPPSIDVWPEGYQGFQRTNNQWYDVPLPSPITPHTTPSQFTIYNNEILNQPLQTLQQPDTKPPNQPHQQQDTNQYISFQQLLQLAFTNGQKIAENINGAASAGKGKATPVTATTPTTTTTTTTAATTTKPYKMTKEEMLVLKALLEQQEIFINKFLNQFIPSTLQKAKSPTTAPTTPKPTTTTPKSRGCFVKGKYYLPLMEIDRGQSGDWCYGSYCTHDSIIVYWDDHKCTPAPTTPLAPPPTTTMALSANGCWYQGSWYAPGADISNGRNYFNCYGAYCDYTSTVINWEDNCAATVAPVDFSGGDVPSNAASSGTLPAGDPSELPGLMAEL